MENAQAAEGWPSENFANMVKPAVLAVDDDERGLFAMAEVLRDEKYDVVVAHSGDEALKHLLRKEFAVILMDVRMPGLSGYETATLIRNRDRTRTIPIIFMTAFNKEEMHVFEGYSAGAVDYLFKPIKPEILKAKASVFCDLYRSKEAARQLYEALKRREEEQSLVLRLLPIALYKLPFTEALDAPRFVRGNVEELTGFPPDRFLNDGKLWAERIHPADRAQALHDFARISEERAVTVEYRWQRADGTHRHLLDQAVLVRHGGGRGEVFGLWLDISDRKQLEQKLYQAHRLEKLGLLMGGVAHDFGNLLTIIMASLDRLEAMGSANDGMNNAVVAAQRAAARGEDLIHQLLAFSRQRTLRPQKLELPGYVQNTVDLLRGALPGAIRIETDIPSEVWEVCADRSELELALLNIAANARDAMPEGGVLYISARNVVLNDDQESGLVGEYVALSMRDTGHGMPPDVLARVFEPFFTTKPAGKGTGLGLSQVHGFAKQSGGMVEVDSEAGRGTCVTVYLPRWRPEGSERASS